MAHPEQLSNGINYRFLDEVYMHAGVPDVDENARVRDLSNLAGALFLPLADGTEFPVVDVTIPGESPVVQPMCIQSGHHTRVEVRQESSVRGRERIEFVRARGSAVILPNDKKIEVGHFELVGQLRHSLRNVATIDEESRPRFDGLVLPGLPSMDPRQLSRSADARTFTRMLREYLAQAGLTQRQTV
jgi:hypothetical protein